MNKNILFIVHDPGLGRLSLGFASMAAADAFLRGQSNNPQWLAQWDVRFLPERRQGLAVVASCNKYVSLNFDLS